MIKYIARSCQDSKNFCEKVFWASATVGRLEANDGESKNNFPTEFSIMKSENYLYFKFRCFDDLPKAEMTGYNMPLYDEEVVEMFFSSNKSEDRYLEVELNHLNTVFCAHIDHDKGNKINYIDKNPIESCVEKQENVWCVYGRIPRQTIENFDNNEWTFNAYRIKRNDKNELILSAFSPTLVENFHMPERFAIIEFN